MSPATPASLPPSISEARRQPVVVRSRLSAPGICVELCDFPTVRGEDWTTSEIEPILSLGLSPLLPESQGRYRPGPHRRFASFGPLHFRPAGVPLQVRYAAGPFSSLRCRFDPAHFTAVTGLGGAWSDEQLDACLDIRQTRIEDALLRLSEECAEPGADSAPLAAALGMVALIDLGRFLRDARERAAQSRGGLSARHLRRIAEHVARATDPPSVEELARLCDLSRFHFMRAFRQSTGTTVAKYVEAARVSRAKKLLVTSELPLTEIAAVLGFCSPASFSTVFRRATGRNPRNYRDHMR